MHIARTLLIASALLSLPWIAGAPQSAAASPAATTAGPGLRSAPETASGLLRRVADRDHNGDHDRHHHHRSHHRHHHHQHDGDHDQGDHGH